MKKIHAAPTQQQQLEQITWQIHILSLNFPLFLTDILDSFPTSSRPRRSSIVIGWILFFEGWTCWSLPVLVREYKKNQKVDVLIQNSGGRSRDHKMRVTFPFTNMVAYISLKISLQMRSTFLFFLYSLEYVENKNSEGKKWLWLDTWSLDCDEEIN